MSWPLKRRVVIDETDNGFVLELWTPNDEPNEPTRSLHGRFVYESPNIEALIERLEIYLEKGE